MKIFVTNSNWYKKSFQYEQHYRVFKHQDKINLKNHFFRYVEWKEDFFVIIVICADFFERRIIPNGTQEELMHHWHSTP